MLEVKYTDQAKNKKIIDKLKIALGIRTRQDRNYFFLVIPIVAFLAIFFIYPLTKIFFLSFQTEGGIITLENYRRIFNEKIYFDVLMVTFEYSLAVTIICAILAYPIASLLTNVSKSLSGKLMILILLPFWTSILIRAYAWCIILSRNGFINQLLLDVGLINDPLKLIYNRFGMILGTVHVLLPYMIFPLYAVMSGINKNLLKASQSLGANHVKTFTKVFFPLSFPGLAAGSLVVFILCLGFYVTPALMGGRKDLVITVLIEQQVREMLNWGFASALSFVLLAITIVFYFIATKWLGVDKIWGGVK